MRRVTALVACAALTAMAAWGDGVSGLIEEDYGHTSSRISDSTGGLVSTSDQLVQRYRLALDRSPFPLMRFSLAGTFEQFLASANSGGVSSDLSSRTASVFGNVAVGNPFLSAAAGYSLREQTSGTTATPFGFVSEDMNLLLTWRPTDLPSFSLRLARPSLHDRERQTQDLTTNQALLSIVYAPVREVDLRYNADLENPIDRLHHTNLTTITQAGRATYDARFLGGRSTVSLSASVVNQRFQVLQSGAGGTTQTPLAPTAGYSLVEAFPNTPALDTLVQNGAVINGDTVTSTGLNLGVSRALAGDVAYRDVGVQFPDTITRVNTLWLWVDKQLPAALAAQIAWTVWRSDDNLNWTQIAATQTVFNAFEPRFEITIPETQTRYLKIVAPPLAAGASLDPQYRDVFVTELQPLLITAVTPTRGWQSNTGEVLSASARTRLTDSPLLTHDIFLFLTNGTRPGTQSAQTWLVANGLSLSQKLTEILLFSARAARQDSNQSRGHEGEWQYSASLGATPLPLLTSSFVYSGRVNTSALGTTATNGVSLFAQATPYRGVGVLGNASYGLTSLPTGQDSRAESLTFSGTVQPHSNLTMAGTWGHSASVTTGGGLARSVSVSNRVEGTASFSPFRALYVSGTISRTVVQPHPVTLGSGTVSFSPFQGGDLQFSLAYTQSLEGDGTINRLLSPSIRWNLRHATLTASYSLLETEGPVQNTSSRTLDVNLRIPL